VLILPRWSSIGCSRRRMMVKLLPADTGDSKSAYRAAVRIARSSLDDEHAKRELERDVVGYHDGVREAATALGKHRTEFVTDRAFRLLDAVLREAPVQAISPEYRDTFLREEELGRINVTSAFERLVAIEPRLGECAGALLQTLLPNQENDKFSFGEQLSTLVGPGAQHPDPLVRSQLALSIASYYIAIVEGKLPSDTKDEAYFSARRRLAVRSSA
jgi:hypothetical protein